MDLVSTVAVEAVAVVDVAVEDVVVAVEEVETTRLTLWVCILNHPGETRSSRISSTRSVLPV